MKVHVGGTMDILEMLTLAADTAFDTEGGFLGEITIGVMGDG